MNATDTPPPEILRALRQFAHRPSSKGRMNVALGIVEQNNGQKTTVATLLKSNPLVPPSKKDFEQAGVELVEILKVSFPKELHTGARALNQEFDRLDPDDPKLRAFTWLLAEIYRTGIEHERMGKISGD